MSDSILAPELLQAAGVALANASHTALIAVGPDGRMAYANPCARRAMGELTETLRGIALEPMVLAEDRPRLHRLLSVEGASDPEFLRFANDGPSGVRALALWSTLLMEGAGASVLLIGRDAGPDVMREARVRAAQRFELVGQLASGIAHELNNALSTVTTFSDLLLAGAAAGSDNAADLGEIKQAALDAAAIIRKLDRFARGAGADSRTETSVPEVVRGMRKLLAQLLTRNVALTVQADDATPPVWAAPVHLEEILVALAANARDALGGAGAVTVTLRPGGTPDAPTAVLEFAVTGPGARSTRADPSVEPFSSSKSPTVGTGLGLDTVDRLVRELGGTFRLGAGPGGAARATVELPACSEPSPQRGE